MTSRAYPRLGIVEFGRNLLSTLDLDPAYVAFTAPGVLPGPEAQARWLLSYWCYYDVGLACWMSELEARRFWELMIIAARNEGAPPVGGRWPRGRERRHFRGQAAITAAFELYTVCNAGGEPLGLVERIYEAAPKASQPASSVMARAQELPMFGPWIAFKVADMLETCLGWPVDFTNAEVFMFDTPREAALMVWRERFKLPAGSRPKVLSIVLEGVVQWLLGELGGKMAPPRFKRPLGLQEAETILCKWKSHMGGHYPLGHDTTEFRAGLGPWARVCPTAARFLEALPKGGS